MFGLTVNEFKKLYFPKYHETGVITADVVKNAKRCSDEFHDFLVNSVFYSSVSCFRVYDNELFGFYKQAERCLKSGYYYDSMGVFSVYLEYNDTYAELRDYLNSRGSIDV